jgi:tRNA nucleotidyltransferase (CCA-adding enzyme)
MYYAEADLSSRLAAMLHDIGKPCTREVDEKGIAHYPNHPIESAWMAKEWMVRMRYDNDTIDEVLFLIENHMTSFKLTPKTIRKYIHSWGRNRLEKLMRLHAADKMATGTEYQVEIKQQLETALEKIDRTMAQKPPCQFQDLAISGDEIMSIRGIKPGPEVGKIKRLLMDVVLEYPKLNTVEDLTYMVKYYQDNNDITLPSEEGENK